MKDSCLKNVSIRVVAGGSFQCWLKVVQYHVIEGKSKYKPRFIPNLTFCQHFVLKIKYCDPCEEVRCFDVMAGCRNCRIPQIYLKVSDDSRCIYSVGATLASVFSSFLTVSRHCTCECFCSVCPFLECAHVILSCSYSSILCAHCHPHDFIIKRF